MNKKKVCIATWYGPNNYGTGLQAYALSRFLNKNNCESYFINDFYIEKKAFRHSIRGIRKKIQNFFAKCLSRLRILFVGLKNDCPYYYKNDLKIKSIMQHNFIAEAYKTINISNEDDLIFLNTTFDIFIAGSDQIWNPHYFSLKFFLAMASNDKHKISYASSLGISSVPMKYHRLYKKYLEGFYAISVRENFSKVALSKIINMSIREVVDPTLLLNTKDWNNLADNAQIDFENFEKDYLLCYFVGNRKSYWKYVELIKQSTGLHVIVLPINREGFKNNYEKYVKVTPSEFIWLIKNAKIICTDSYHATLFSIQYQKDFYVLKRFRDKDKKSQNRRLVDILKMFYLEDRLIHDETSFRHNKIHNYNDIICKLNMMRTDSQQWLLNNLTPEKKGLVHGKKID